jgi:exonuclease SbcD
MKFIHLADAHLDSPFRGLSFLPSTAFQEIKQAAAQSLSRIVDLALKEQVDLVLIAGDSFDSINPSPKSQLFLFKQIKRLCQAQIQVVMILGNHDYAVSDLLLPQNPYFKLLGANEEVERASFTTKTGFKYDVVGFSYRHNHLSDQFLPQFPAKSQNYTFGLMHAQLMTKRASQDVYAPFNLKQLQELNYDYFALGHIHKRQIISQEPLAAYAGNIQGRHINESGAKGCYLGQVDEHSRQTQLQFEATAPITWRWQKLSLNKAVDKNELDQQLKASLQAPGQNYYYLQLVGAENLTSAQTDLMTDPDYWLSLDLAHHSYLVAVALAANQQLQLNPADQASFEQAEAKAFAEDNLAQLTKAWAHKDEFNQDLLADPQFIQTVKQLTQAKLANKLKGIKNETDGN